MKYIKSQRNQEDARDTRHNIWFAEVPKDAGERWMEFFKSMTRKH